MPRVRHSEPAADDLSYRLKGSGEAKKVRFIPITKKQIDRFLQKETDVEKMAYLDEIPGTILEQEKASYSSSSTSKNELKNKNLVMKSDFSKMEEQIEKIAKKMVKTNIQVASKGLHWLSQVEKHRTFFLLRDLAYAYAMKGDADKCLGILEEMKEHVPYDKQQRLETLKKTKNLGDLKNFCSEMMKIKEKEPLSPGLVECLRAMDAFYTPISKKLHVLNQISSLLPEQDKHEIERFTEENEKGINTKILEILESDEKMRMLPEKDKNSLRGCSSQVVEGNLSEKICALLKDSLGNEKLASFLYQKKPRSIAEEFLRGFAFGTGDYETLRDTTLPSIEKALESVEGKSQKNMEDALKSSKHKPPLTIKDIKVLQRVADLNASLVSFLMGPPKIVLETTEELDDILDTLEKASKLRKKLDKLLQSANLPSYTSGDVLIELEQRVKYGEGELWSRMEVNVKNTVKFIKKVWNGELFQAQPYIVGDEKHASFICRKIGPDPIRETEIITKYENGPVSFYSAVLTKRLHPNFEKLLTPDGLQAAQDKFGKNNVRNKLGELYDEIISSYYSKNDKTFRKTLEFSAEKATDSPIKDFILQTKFVKVIGYPLWGILTLWHAVPKWIWTSCAKMSNFITRTPEDGKSPMFCSEYVATTIKNTLTDLEKNLVSQLGCENVLNPVISDDVDIETLYPRKLSELLKNNDMFKEAETPLVVRYLVDLPPIEE